jgi:hypothetical protein
MPKQDKKYSVKGRITNLANKPVEGLEVKAYDKDPKSPDTQLGKATTTNALGEYTIEYVESDFRIKGLETGGADIVVIVYTADGKALVQSPLLKNTKQTSTARRRSCFYTNCQECA